MVIFDRSVIERGRSTARGEGSLLLGRRRRNEAQRLEGAETGPEQDDGK
jgi:hypothetical protein